MTKILFNDDCIEVLTEFDCMANSTEKADIAVISDCNGEPISQLSER